MSDQTPATLATLVRDAALRIDFDLVGISAAVTPVGFDHLKRWLDHGYAGEMQYMPRRESAYEHPDGVLPGTKSVIVTALNYHTGNQQAGNQSAASTESDNPAQRVALGKVASYASGTGDYHDVLRRMLQQLAAVLHAAVPNCRTRLVVDTAPFLERDFAKIAGLGWFGKNTMLINKRAGSWLFLGALLTDVELEPDAPHETSHCGTCTRCLDACPTDAFVEPYVLDARKCISYLTIELRDGPIPTSLRDDMQDWVFGCDICQDVCPWNRKASDTAVPEFLPAEDLSPLDLNWLLSLTEDEFQTRFRKTPFDRPARSGLLRNAAIAAGNIGDESSIPCLTECLSDNAVLVRGAAAWAIGKLGGEAARMALQNRLLTESDPAVKSEIEAALRACS
ncbi:MAG: tRNA epoxyqueuosine(34) reductase QueG [Planctomycetota bacterium]|nr:tRNA epoxyqueuosine(34) reductase QueG [Planctomycetota bacterium]MDA1164888.1 tRNA epoxyqueuosine(34) reductase QueG [Planctomycetota bacterium]